MRKQSTVTANITEILITDINNLLLSSDNAALQTTSQRQYNNSESMEIGTVELYCHSTMNADPAIIIIAKYCIVFFYCIYPFL